MAAVQVLCLSTLILLKVSGKVPKKFAEVHCSASSQAVLDIKASPFVLGGNNSSRLKGIAIHSSSYPSVDEVMNG